MHSLVRHALIAAAIALFLYSLLALGERVFPQFYPTRVELWLLPLLFVVGFLPRLIGWLAGLIPRRKRRKT